MPNAISTNSAIAVMSNWDIASSKEVPPRDSGEPGIIFGVGLGVGGDVVVGIGVIVGSGVDVGVETGAKVAVERGVSVGVGARVGVG